MTVLNEEDIERAVRRLAVQAIELCGGTDFVLVGIRTRGVILAQRMRREILRLEHADIPLGVLDIALYRDDLLDGCDAVFKGSEIGFDLDGKNVVLCDDVLYTGRTVRAAMAALASLGRARSVKLFVLVDRGHRELPFAADAVGKHLPTSRRERVAVRFRETDGVDATELVKE